MSKVNTSSKTGFLRIILVILLIIVTEAAAGNYWLKVNHSTMPLESVFINEGNDVSPGLSDFTLTSIIKDSHGSPFCTYRLPCMGIGVNGFFGFILDFATIRGMVFSDNPAAYCEYIIGHDTVYFLALTCDRSETNGTKMYINGTLVDTKDPTGQIATDYVKSGSQLFIYYGDGGYIDQIRFYKSIVLTPEQIQAIYYSGVGVKVNENDFNAISPNGWYTDLDVNNSGNFLGRVNINGVWSDSNLTVAGDTTWEAGGVPFETQISVSAFRRNME
jgi:hypothetical protein